MYPADFQTIVTVPVIARRWEGAARPHHFAGVATVVTKLFRIVQPHLAWFGQKDYQQAALVRQLVHDLNLGVKILIRPTVRERDGLAMSSRNVYLSANERRMAPLLSQALRVGGRMIADRVRDVAAIEHAMRQTLKREPTIHVEYLAVCDPDSLEPLPVVTTHAVLLSAVRVGSIRLIDNLLVKISS
jgi:pantoate--beta-alanine ligase